MSHLKIADEKVEDELTGEALTAGYRPTLPVALFTGATILPYWWLYRDIEAMLLHPCVAIGMSYFRSAIWPSRFKVESDSPAVAEFVEKNLLRYWSANLSQVQEAESYGWSAHEIIYRVEDGQLHFDTLDTFSPWDVTLLTTKRKYVGFRVKGVPGGALDLWGPLKGPAKGYWYAHRPRFQKYYGRSQLYGAWRPWRRLAGRDGAEEVIDGGVYRFAYSGPIVRFPAKDELATIRNPGPTRQSAREVARQIAENAKAGVSIAVPSGKYPAEQGGGDQWSIDFPTSTLNVSGLLEYNKSLADQILLGIGVPPELLQASDTGSGYSGRNVPKEAFYLSRQGDAHHQVATWREQIGDPLVLWNFGEFAKYQIEIEPLLASQEQQASGAPGGYGANPLASLMGGAGGPSGGLPTQMGTRRAEVIRLATMDPSADDSAADSAERVIRVALTALAKVNAATAKQLQRELLYAGQADRPQRLRDVLARWRDRLARLLGDARIAALVSGAADALAVVGDSIDNAGAGVTVGPGRLLPQDPSSPAPAAGLDPDRLPALDALADASKGVNEIDRDRYLKGLTDAEDAYVRSRWSAPPEPPADDWAVATSPGEPEPVVTFPAIAEGARRLQAKRVLTRPQFDALADAARQDAFTVARVQEEDALVAVQTALAESVGQGRTMREFADDLTLQGIALPPAHMENVFRTNIQSAYSQGMEAVCAHPQVADAFPYRAYDAIHDARTEPTHLAMETSGIQGTNVYRADDPVWKKFQPPWRYQCRCAWTPLSIEDAARKGIREAVAWQATGVPPANPARVPMPPFEPPPGWVRMATKKDVVQAEDAETRDALRLWRMGWTPQQTKKGTIKASRDVSAQKAEKSKVEVSATARGRAVAHSSEVEELPSEPNTTPAVVRLATPPVPVTPPVPTVTVKEVERDADGRIARIIERTRPEGPPDA